MYTSTDCVHVCLAQVSRTERTGIIHSSRVCNQQTNQRLRVQVYTDEVTNERLAGAGQPNQLVMARPDQRSFSHTDSGPYGTLLVIACAYEGVLHVNIGRRLGAC